LRSLRISARGSDAAQAPQLENRYTRKGIGASNTSSSASDLISQSVRRARASCVVEKPHRPTRDSNSPTLGLSAPLEPQGHGSKVVGECGRKRIQNSRIPAGFHFQKTQTHPVEQVLFRAASL